VTAGALGGVPTAEITVDGIEPRSVVLYFHGGVYVMGDAFLAADLAPPDAGQGHLRRLPTRPRAPVSGSGRRRCCGYEAHLDDGIAPSNIAFAGESAGGAWPSPAWSTSRSRAAPMGRGPRHVTVCRSHPGGDDHGNQTRRRSAAQQGGPPSPSRRLYVGTGRRSWPDQPPIRTVIVTSARGKPAKRRLDYGSRTR
jgi:hypothetical protein